MSSPFSLASREWPVPMVWAVLTGASLIGFIAVEQHTSARIAGTLAIALAAIKIHLVFDQYMDIRWRHRPLRQLLAGWLAVVVAILLAAVWAA